MESQMDKLENQLCPVCHTKNLKLLETQIDVPFFGLTYVFSMECTHCGFLKSDVEADVPQDPTRYTLEVTSEEDLNIRIVKSSEATIKIPHVTTITPGPAAQGFITNVEGLIRQIKGTIEKSRDSAEENTDKKKAKNLIKKLNKVLWGEEKLKIIIEDPTGNSTIVSEKAKKDKIKGKR